tara:strand:+ start:349 stop:531 length:183 start_codon:yes stop_codon:yes gene_type:complete
MEVVHLSQYRPYIPNVAGTKVVMITNKSARDDHFKVPLMNLLIISIPIYLVHGSGQIRFI